MTDKERRLAELFGEEFAQKSASSTVSNKDEKTDKSDGTKPSVSSVAKKNTPYTSKPVKSAAQQTVANQNIKQPYTTQKEKQPVTSKPITAKSGTNQTITSKPITSKPVRQTVSNQSSVNRPQPTPKTNQQINSSTVREENSASAQDVTINNMSLKATQIVSKDHNAYSKIKKRILKHKESDATAEKIFREWLNEDKTITLCVVSVGLVRDIESALKNDTIPYSVFKNFRLGTFVIRDIDKMRFIRVINQTKRSLEKGSVAWSYDEFQTVASQNDEPTVALNGLSETEMEFLRRDIVSRGEGKQYGMYKTNNKKWSLAFFSSDLAENVSSRRNTLGVLESSLYMYLIFSGPDAKKFRERVNEDVRTDRLASTYFNIPLQNNNEVYVYDPSEKPKKAMKITKEGYDRMSVVKKDGVFTLKSDKLFDLSTIKGIRAFIRDLINMKHKITTFSMREILNLANNWITKKKEEKHLREAEDSAKQMAHIIYEHFAMEHKNEEWFKTPSKSMEKISQFKKYVGKTLKAFAQNRVPSGFKEKEADLVYACMKTCELSPAMLADAAYSINIAEFDKPGQAKTVEKFVPLDTILFDYEKEKEMTSAGSAFVR